MPESLLQSIMTPQSASVSTDQMLNRNTVGVGDRFSNKPRNRSYQATISGTGAVSATVKIEASNDLLGWVPLATITLSGTAIATDGAISESAWTHVRANLTAISGTGANVIVTMGSATDV